MPRFLHQISYTSEAMASLIANPHDRFETVRGPIEKLGGKIVVITKKGEGHYPLAPQAPKLVVDFITKAAQ